MSRGTGQRVYQKPPGAGWPLRGVLLFLLPAPLIAVALGALTAGQSARLLVTLLALGLIWLGAVLNRQGLMAEAAFAKRRIAAAPRTPKKALAAVLVGVGAGVSAVFVAKLGVVGGAVVAGLALVGTRLAYGADPRGDKGVATAVPGYSTEEIVAALQDAEAKIDAIDAAARSIDAAAFSAKLRAVADAGRGVLKVIEDDPKDLRRARKFLHVYLDGATDVATRFVQADKAARSETIDANFADMLDTIEASFHETRDKLLADDALNLDVQIEVLTTRLKKEGVI